MKVHLVCFFFVHFLNNIWWIISLLVPNAKSSPSPITSMPEAEITSERGEKIAIDIVGPLPKAKGNFRLIFTCLELACGYHFAIHIRNYTSE